MPPVGKQEEDGRGSGGQRVGDQDLWMQISLGTEMICPCVPVKSVSFIRQSLEGKLEHLPVGSHLDGQFLSLSQFILTATL